MDNSDLANWFTRHGEVILAGISGGVIKWVIEKPKDLGVAVGGMVSAILLSYYFAPILVEQFKLGDNMIAPMGFAVGVFGLMFVEIAYKQAPNLIKSKLTEWFKGGKDDPIA